MLVQKVDGEGDTYLARQYIVMTSNYDINNYYNIFITMAFDKE